MYWTVGENKYEFDGKMTVAECIQFKEKSGLGYREIDPAIAKGDIHALMCMTYVMKRRAGEAVKWEDMMKLNPGDLGWTLTEAELAELAAKENPAAAEGQEGNAEKAGPTKRTAGKTPKGDTSST